MFYGQQPSSTAPSDIMRLAAWSSQSTRKDTIFMGVEPNARNQARLEAGAQRTLEGVGSSAWFGADFDTDTGTPDCC